MYREGLPRAKAKNQPKQTKAALSFLSHKRGDKMGRKAEKATKEDRIKSYVRKLKQLIRDIPPERASLAAKIIDELAFQTATLEDLREVINRDGVITEVTNGNGITFMGESPESKAYNVLIKNYNATVTALSKVVQIDTATGAEPAIMKYLQDTRVRR